MAFPKGFKKNIKIVKDKVGFERRQEILDDIDRKGTFLPRGVMYEDMDKSFIEFVNKDLQIVIDGETVPVIFLTLQRWSEFSKTWQHADKYKNIKMPFITIVRQPNPQVGNNQAGLFNIPGRRTYTYMKVPTFEGGRKGVDVYKIPQPTSVDITYEVRLFCNRMRDLNKINIKVQHAFNAIQHYIRVNGHPMPLLLQSIGDESNIDDFENRRFYVQPYEIKLEGYVLDEDQFEVIPAINRALVVTEISDNPKTEKFKPFINRISGEICYTVEYKMNAELEFSFIAQHCVKITKLDRFIGGVTNVTITINGVEVFNGMQITTPIMINDNDRVTIKVDKTSNMDCSFKMIGDITNRGINIDNLKKKNKLKFSPILSANKGTFSYDIVYRPNSEPDFRFTSECDNLITDIINIDDVTNIIIKINGIEKFNGINFSNNLVINQGDEIYIKIGKGSITTQSGFTLIGKII